MNNHTRATVNQHDIVSMEREFLDDSHNKLEARVHQLEAQIDLVCNKSDTKSRNLLQMAKSSHDSKVKLLSNGHEQKEQHGEIDSAYLDCGEYRLEANMGEFKLEANMHQIKRWSDMIDSDSDRVSALSIND